MVSLLFICHFLFLILNSYFFLSFIFSNCLEVRHVFYFKVASGFFPFIFNFKKSKVNQYLNTPC